MALVKIWVKWAKNDSQTLVGFVNLEEASAQTLDGKIARSSIFFK